MAILTASKALLADPGRFFRGRSEVQPMRWVPMLLPAAAFSLVGAASVLAERRLPLEISPALRLFVEVPVHAIVGFVYFVVVYCIPVRLVAGRNARARETAGLCAAPFAIASILLLPLALALPFESSDLGASELAAGSMDTRYDRASGVVIALGGLATLILLYRALQALAPKRAGSTIAWILGTNVFMTAVLPTVAGITSRILTR